MAGSDRNNSGTNINSGIVARVSGALRAAVSADTWFGPLKPLNPVAPEDTAGRQFDYATGYNLNQKPRAYEPVTFDQMRALADGLDVLRLVIETRKDQLAAMEWEFKPKDDSKDHDPRCDELNAFFQLPDQEHTWSDWLRMLLEDLFVLDAPAVYPRKTKGGQVYGFDAIDGATIKRVLDAGGRTPLPPYPAYQQVLKGLPAVDYTRDELVYKPRNPRTNRVYGYSPVEQIIMTVNIAIRRQISQLSYYTDGSTPDLIFGVPKEWNPDQIKAFQNYWNETLAGNLQGRRGTKFVPDGVAPINTKDQILKDAYDEWLARIICYAFSVSPTPFIKETNRATAETALQSARDEGLLPLMGWTKDFINYLVVKYFGYTDITFCWLDKSELDPLVKAQVDKIYLEAKVLTDDEVRHESLGKPPLTAEQREQLTPPPPMIEGQDPNAPDSEVIDPKKAQPAPVTKARAIKPINRNRKAVTKPRAQLTKAIQVAFASAKTAAISALAKSQNGSLTKGRRDDWEQLSFPELSALNDDLEKALSVISGDGVAVAFVQVSYNNDEALNQANDKAIEWSKNRSAELVGKKWVDGELVDNPDSTYSIEDSTREGIKALVNQAEAEGWANDRLADELANSYQFSDERADMIARTETAFADMNGNMIAYRESGVVSGKQWLLAPDSCDDCQANAEQGVIDLGDEFQDGSDCAPAHPRCVCDCSPVVSTESEEE